MRGLGDAEDLARGAEVQAGEVVEDDDGDAMRHGPILSHVGFPATRPLSPGVP
jgi:hypothetical protein